jgi:acetyl esterase/lipase
VNIFPNESIDLIKTREKFNRSIPFSRKHSKVDIETVNIDGVNCEWLRPTDSNKNCVILYLHGGAWFMGSPEGHRSLVSRIAFQSKSYALSVDYRLTPEYPYPAGLDDCITTYRWLIKQRYDPKNIVIAGDSAGGNLTLASLIRLRDEGDPLPGCAVVISPATDLTGDLARRKGSSFHTRLKKDVFFSRMVNFQSNSITEAYCTTHNPGLPYISPLQADLEGLPRMLIHVGDEEILLDDTLEFTKKARTAGVDVTEVVWPYMFHVFHICAPFLPEANRAIKEIGEFIHFSFSSNYSK